MGDGKIWDKFYPEGVPRTFAFERPFTEYVREWARRNPQAVALDYYGREMSYEELNDSIDRFAGALLEKGLRKGDRVALYLQNCPHFVIAFFGVIRAGGIVVCFNPMYKQIELKSILANVGAHIVVTMPELYPQISQLREAFDIGTVILADPADFIPEEPVFPPPPEADQKLMDESDTIDFLSFLKASAPKPVCNTKADGADVVLLQLTGGTTGEPKAAMVTMKAFTTAMLSAQAWFGLTNTDVNLGLAPFFHTMGQQCVMCPALISGGKLVILGRFVADIVAKALEHYKCTMWVAAPTMLNALVNLPDIEKTDFSSLRVIFTGGAPVTTKLQQEIKRLAPNSELGEGYGMTETLGPGGAATPLGKWRSGFVGIPQINDMKIVDIETGLKEMPLNEVGEIIVKGPTVMKGYWNDPEGTDKVFKDGWYYTGDIGLMDENGYIKLVDRKKEMLICSGYNVYPTDVENIMHQHPAIYEVAVIGVPDAYRGESPKAFVILKDEFKGKVTDTEIVDWCRENMANYKRPRTVEIREILPKSAAGKILKRALK